MFRQIRLGVLVIFVFAVSFSGRVQGHGVDLVPVLQSSRCTYYVDNQVGADGDGSWFSPWRTISGHVNDLAPGDIMCVRGDTSAPGRIYTEPMLSLDKNSGTASGTEVSPIIVRVYSDENVVLRTTGMNILEFAGVTHWQFDGFVLDKESKGGYAVHFRWANDNVVRNCEIYDGTGEGIHFTYGERNLVENCKIHDFDAGPYKDAHCILMAGGRSNVIRGNELYDCTGDGIQFFPYHDLSGTIVENNHFYSTLGPCAENAIDFKIGGELQTIIRRNVMHGYRTNDGSCGGSSGTVGEAIMIHQQAVNILVEANEIYDSGSGIRVTAGENIHIVNNLIHDIVTEPAAWANFGIQVYGGVTINVLNNTLVNVPRHALVIGGGRLLDLDIRNNLFYNTGLIDREDAGTEMTADYNGWFRAVERIAGSHDVVGFDPMFVSPGDYHLWSSSPVVDAGDTASSPTYDFDGNPRPYGLRVDLGAFEVQEPSPVNDLRASGAVTTTTSVAITLVWTAPGRAGQAGTAHHYELRHSDQAITQESWSQAAVMDSNIIAGQPGETQSITVSLPWDGSGHLYFALRVFDVESRVSRVSNSAFWPFESMFLPLIQRQQW